MKTQQEIQTQIDFLEKALHDVENGPHFGSQVSMLKLQIETLKWVLS